MLSGVNLQSSSLHTLEKVVRQAFAPQSRKGQRKGCLRAVNRVLSLAKERGYTQAEKFVTSFKVEPYSQQQGHYLLEGLFEYVSADEMRQLLSAYIM